MIKVSWNFTAAPLGTLGMLLILFLGVILQALIKKHMMNLAIRSNFR
jgi:hypothetical protein